MTSCQRLDLAEHSPIWQVRGQSGARTEVASLRHAGAFHGVEEFTGSLFPQLHWPEARRPHRHLRSRTKGFQNAFPWGRKEKISRRRYNLPVRRLLSIIFLFLFSVQLISPVLALAASSDANLSACCRRNGAHHCIMKMQQAEPSGPGISLAAIPQRCPAYPALI